MIAAVDNLDLALAPASRLFLGDQIPALARPQAVAALQAAFIEGRAAVLLLDQYPVGHPVRAVGDVENMVREDDVGVGRRLVAALQRERGRVLARCRPVDDHVDAPEDAEPPIERLHEGVDRAALAVGRTPEGLNLGRGLGELADRLRAEEILVDRLDDALHMVAAIGTLLAALVLLRAFLVELEEIPVLALRLEVEPGPAAAIGDFRQPPVLLVLLELRMPALDQLLQVNSVQLVGHSELSVAALRHCEHAQCRQGVIWEWSILSAH